MSDVGVSSPLAGDPRWARRTAALVAVLLGVRLLIALLVQLAPDEAYYWVWSQRLSIGYFDHPPAVAWLLWLTTLVGGNTVFGVRLAALLCSAVTSAMVYGFALDLFGHRRAGFLAVAVASALPLLAAGAIIVTPDTPQGVAFVGAAWCLWRATTRPSARGWWLATGAAAGAALLSKYVAVLFGVFALCWVLLDADRRKHLLTPWPYLGAAIAALLFAPVVVWNAQHEWASFLFQLGHGLGVRRGGLLSVGEYLGGQIGLITPPLLFLAAATWKRGHLSFLSARNANAANENTGLEKLSDPFSFLACWGVPMLSIFVISAWRGPTEANWPSPAHVAVALSVAGLWNAAIREGRAGWKRACAVGVGIAAAATGIAHVYLAQPWVEVPGDRTRQRITGWKELSGVVQAEVDRLPADRVWVVTDSYQYASELAFYGVGVEHVGVWPGTGRISQFDLWGAPELRGGDAVIYVATGERAVPADLRQRFGRVSAPMTVPIPGIDGKGRPRSVTVFSLQDHLGALGGVVGTTEDRS